MEVSYLINVCHHSHEFSFFRYKSEHVVPFSHTAKLKRFNIPNMKLMCVIFALCYALVRGAPSLEDSGEFLAWVTKGINSKTQQ